MSFRQDFSIAMIAESKKVYNQVNISRNSLKRQSDHLNIDPNLYLKYRNPSLSGSQGIVLTRFFYCFNGRVENEALLSQYNLKLAQKLIRSFKY